MKYERKAKANYLMSVPIRDRRASWHSVREDKAK
jgi:hypothetical protein